jgi:hypothetical protein
MHTVTWKTGTDTKLDNLFTSLRKERYLDTSHRLYKNYGDENFLSTTPIALTICFDDNNIPEVCSSIAIRNCWPNNVYRIHNRMWKASNRKPYVRRLSDSVGYATLSQIDWLKSNTNCELCFISRQTETWENWLMSNLNEHFGCNFKSDNHKYLTCPNECDQTCWQKIIYMGDERILEKWQRR